MIYLDNNATTPLHASVFETMKTFMTGEFANPSSAHSLAIESRNAVQRAREQVAGLIGANDQSEIYFTSGGTESDNWAVFGSVAARPDRKKIITTKVEHEAVRKSFDRLEASGFETVRLDVEPDGTLDSEVLLNELDDTTALVSIMLANNETGVIFQVEDLARLVKANSEAAFHVDAVNAAGKIPIDVKNTEIDLLSISGHKFQGPKGVGALYVRNGFEIESGAVGGGQEFGKRAGTEAVHQIAGLGMAAELASDLETMENVRILRDMLEDGILSTIDGSQLNGNKTKRLPNTSNISFPGLNGELILNSLDRAGICVSTGSACNEIDHVASPVLRAMEVPYNIAMGAIRFSLGRQNTENEIVALLTALPGIIKEVIDIQGRD